jgi:hypothetical protein
MSFPISNLRTGQVVKVEFKSDPDFSNVAFENFNGSNKNLLIFNVPSALGNMLALNLQFPPGAPDNKMLVEVDQAPQMLGGDYYEANYAGRIEVTRP